MALADVRDRLQPALLDRLTDEAREFSSEAEDRRIMSKAHLRQAVLRDLGWLLNAVQPLPVSAARQHPHAVQSVLNFGLPALSGQLASKIDVSWLERAIQEAILRFEPRILSDSLSVKAIESDSVLDTHNVIEFEIRGFLWAQPVPLELLLRTQLDLEAGQVEVRDGLAASAPGALNPRAS
jgi:type VI secretion system protein ImpF